MCIKSFIAISLSLLSIAVALADEEVEDIVLDRWAVSAAGGMVFPGGGHSLDRAASVTARVGYYIAEDFAVETSLQAVPNSTSSTVSSFGINALYHVFGYERFDPFVKIGARGMWASKHVFAHDSHRTAIGPEFGFGAFYHLTESWSLRFDGDMLTAFDSPCSTVFGISLGLQYSFGGED